MSPLLLATLVLGCVTPFAILLGLVAAGSTTGHTPKQVAEGMIDAHRWVHYSRRHPAESKALRDLGFITYADVQALKKRGWTGANVHDVENQFVHITKARRIIEVMSHDAFTTFVRSGDRGWLADPGPAQQWYDTAGPLAPLAMRAGLSLEEADALIEAGEFTEDGLAVLVALSAAPERRRATL